MGNYDRLVTVKKIIIELVRSLDRLFITRLSSPYPTFIYIYIIFRCSEKIVQSKLKVIVRKLVVSFSLTDNHLFVRNPGIVLVSSCTKDGNIDNVLEMPMFQIRRVFGSIPLKLCHWVNSDQELKEFLQYFMFVE